MNTTKKENKQFESELFYPTFTTHRLRSELTKNVKIARKIRKQNTTQSDLSKITGIPLTKVKQIENGTCKDIDAILCYISYLDFNLKIIV